MSAATSATIGLVVALATSTWAGLLAMVQEAAVRSRSMSDNPLMPRAVMPLDEGAHVGRVALLVIAGATASEAVGWWYRPPLPGLGRMLVTLALVYLIAEGIPRSVASLAPRLAAALAPFARLSLIVFAPLIGLASCAKSLARSLAPSGKRRVDRFGKAHRDMLHGVLSLGEATVAEVMTPRLDVRAVASDAEWKDVVELLSRSEHARIPVYTDDLDNVRGVLCAKDITPAIAGVAAVPDDWRDFIQPAPFVPESKALTAQLRDFQRGRAGLAIVVDEFGGTSGLVTLEDVLEEVVGEIYGEYDVDVEPAIETEGNDRFWVDGRFALDDLSELLGRTVECDDVTTVGGLVYSELGHVPKPGEEFRLDDFRVVVEQVARRRVRRVYFERTQPVGPVTDEQVQGG